MLYFFRALYRVHGSLTMKRGYSVPFSRIGETQSKSEIGCKDVWRPLLTSVGLSNCPLQFIVFRPKNAGYIGYCGFLLSQQTGKGWMCARLG